MEKVDEIIIEVMACLNMNIADLSKKEFKQLKEDLHLAISEMEQ